MEKPEQAAAELHDVTSTNIIQTDATKDNTNHYFGIGPCHPKFLQIFASKKFFTFMLCLYALVEGATVSGFIPVAISSLERRYKFSSTASGLLIIIYDVVLVISVISISYFGEKAHKPRWMGVALVTQGIATFVLALPQFLFGKYDIGALIITNSNSTSVLESCNNPIEAVPNCDAGNTVAYVVLLIGQVILGISVAPLFTVGQSFIDDIVFPQYVSLHIGCFQVSTIAGPGIGFGIGSAFLSLYVDVGDSTHLTEDDPAWVGAWWLSFLLASGLSFLCAIPFFFYPRALPDTHLVAEIRQKQMKQSYTSKFGEEKTFLQQVKAFPYHLFGLFKSKSWLFITLGVAVLFLSLDGLVAFIPKYIESVYRIPPSTSGLIVGAIGLLAGAVGTLAGAGIAHCVKIGKNMGIVNWVTTLIAVFPLLGFFLACPSLDVVGIGTQYTNNSLTTTDVLMASCNADCNCSSTVFEPVCGADGLTYFSPCRASCDVLEINNTITYENCSCVASNLFYNGMDNGTYASILSRSTATDGICPTTCNFLPPFLVLVSIFIFLIFLIRVPYTMVIIRTVADEQRTFALGIQQLIVRMFGSIPGPLLFGAIIDSGCVYAQYECDRLANCWVYNNELLRLRVYIFCTLGVAMCVVCVLLAWVFYPPVGCKLASPDDDSKEGDSKESKADNNKKSNRKDSKEPKASNGTPNPNFELEPEPETLY